MAAVEHDLIVTRLYSTTVGLPPRDETCELPGDDLRVCGMGVDQFGVERMDFLLAPYGISICFIHALVVPSVWKGPDPVPTRQTLHGKSTGIIFTGELRSPDEFSL